MVRFKLLGEIDQALDRDAALEAWMLIATCKVPEQTLQSLNLKSERIGVPVLVVDWPSEQAAALAALCTVDPVAVATRVSSLAGDISRRLASELKLLVEILGKELSPWFPGFESLRRESHRVVRSVWTSADMLLQIAFRVSDSAAVRRLRHDLVAPPLCKCDRDLFDAVIAAHASGRIEVIEEIVKLDMASSLPWRRRRGEVLAGFSARSQLPVPGAWPSGPVTTSHEYLRYSASLFAWSDACARHWWSEYLTTADPVLAYAAWTLFLKSADRRAWIWMKNLRPTGAGDTDSARIADRLDFAMLNKSQIEQGMKSREDELGKQFLFRKVCESVAPWLPHSTAHR